MNQAESPVSDEKIKFGFEIKNPSRIVLVLLMVFFLIMLFRNSWYSDDSFITMRVIDNFVNGYGLVWNVGERVQVYTHPLWMLLMLPIYALLRNPFNTIYILSLITSLTTIYLLLRHFAGGYKKMILAALLLASSMAFIDFSSSGLENPLTHLLLILMMIFVLKQPASRRNLLLSSLVASLAAVNRLDTILFFLPIIAYQLFELRQQWRKAIIAFLIGFLPFIAWETFSLGYYGFLFPNTYYAKIATVSFPRAWFYQAGSDYFRNSLNWDPLTLLTIIISMVFVFWEGNLKKICLSLGMFAYLFYVFSIGGDFMSGRFFSASFLVAVALLMNIDYKPLIGNISRRGYLLLLGLIIIIGISADFPPILNRPDSSYQDFDRGIANEKLFYQYQTSWFNYYKNKNIHDWGMNGENLRLSGETYTATESIGSLGFHAGPNVYILDLYALPDALRSKIAVPTYGRIGHLHRPIPIGYEETIKDNFTNHIVHPDLHLYYDKLSILIHAGIFTPGRFREILRFNLGQYDNLIQRYNESPEPK